MKKKYKLKMGTRFIEGMGDVREPEIFSKLPPGASGSVDELGGTVEIETEEAEHDKLKDSGEEEIADG